MKGVGKKLMNLAIRHAQIASEIKLNQNMATTEISLCTGGEFDVEDYQATEGHGVCLNHAFYMTERLNKESSELGEENYTYDEILNNYGCQHCNTTRRLRKGVATLKTERGRIHASITKIGKSFQAENN